MRASIVGQREVQNQNDKSGRSLERSGPQLVRILRCIPAPAPVQFNKTSRTQLLKRSCHSKEQKRTHDCALLSGLQRTKGRLRCFVIYQERMAAQTKKGRAPTVSLCLAMVASGVAGVAGNAKSGHIMTRRLQSPHHFHARQRRAVARSFSCARSPNAGEQK